jgi:hypothetical protein
VILVAACHHHRTQPDLLAACDTVAAQAPREMALSSMAGSYAVAFVATAGLRSGHAVAGRLTLRPQAPSLVTIEPHDGTVITQPSIGQLDMELDSIGAVRMGDPMALDSTMPGIAFYVSHRPGGEASGVIGRVGSASNSRGPGGMDAGHFTLFVRRISTDGIWGGWTSNPGAGGLLTPDARGHFCALKSSGQ